MRSITALAAAILLVVAPSIVRADCPLDHVAVGRDGDTLIADTSQLYRHWNADYGSAPDPQGAGYYETMPMNYPPDYVGFIRIEPGASMIKTGPHVLPGERNVDYRIGLELLDVSPGLEILDDIMTPVFGPGQSVYNISAFPNHHVHMRYFIEGDPDAGMHDPYVAVFRFVDLLEDGDSFAPSQPYTVTLGGCLGDFNGDGAMNGLDIPGFKAALADPDAWIDPAGLERNADRLGDFNFDGSINGLDIPGFKQALAGSPQAVPEPGSMVLVAAGALLLNRRRNASTRHDRDHVLRTDRK